MMTLDPSAWNNPRPPVSVVTEKDLVELVRMMAAKKFDVIWKYRQRFFLIAIAPDIFQATVAALGYGPWPGWPGPGGGWVPFLINIDDPRWGLGKELK